MEIKAQDFSKPHVSQISPRFLELPPSVQRSKELLSILSDNRLSQAIGNSEKIDRIEKNQDGYLIYTERYSIQVNTKYIQEQRFCGPAKFEFEFCQPVPQTSLIDNKLKALPPAFQRTRELIALLSDERLQQILGNSEKIESIERNEKGYFIRTENYTLQVNINYINEEGFCGPAKFEFEFRSLQPR